MILTGSEIEREWSNGRITIDPFVPEQVNPNSYNFRLGNVLRVYRRATLDARTANQYDEIEIPEEGYVLQPRKLYLAHTMEVLGSDHYAPTFAARSSVARLGVFINLSASLGDIGYKGQWTLQLYALHRVRIYAGINIGQMMWWKPQGTIVRYDGKYQGAVGPRASAIHMDFDKQLARQRFPGLGATVDPDEVGPKFAALAACSRAFRVPPAFCVPAGEFAEAISPGPADALEAAFADLRATVGAFFADSAARIRRAASDVAIPESMRKLLATRLDDVFGGAEGPFAVRSSGLDEDGVGGSLAGVHRSVLDVRGLDGVVHAIEECWRSFYETPAVAARVRAGDDDPAPRLAVIVQAMVQPVLAGVAFTGLTPSAPEQVRIEYVEGLADRLVAGLAVAEQVTLGGDGSSDHTTVAVERPEASASVVRPELEKVAATARALRAHQGHEVDVEWAVDDDGVHVLQVRPLTAAADTACRDHAPVAEAVRLYIEALPPGFRLGNVAGIYGGYTAKRGPAYRIAAEHGVAVGGAWVFRFNGRGLHAPGVAGALREALASGVSDECVLDVADGLRQIVVPKQEVLGRLAELTSSPPGGVELRAAIVRDYIRGDLGAISRLAAGRLVVEYTPDGLMALNRGTAGACTVVLDDPQLPSEEVAVPFRAHLGDIARLTLALQERFGPVTLEWVQHRDEMYFIDYSVLGRGEVTLTSSAVQISPGTARGPLLRLDEDELLARLSIGPAVSIDRSTDVSEYEGLARILEKVRSLEEPPIIHAQRPYAVLSVLIDHVAGFVFEQGSLLGHLAILLREAAVPAVAAPGFDGDGEVVVSDGTVTRSARDEVPT